MSGIVPADCSYSVPQPAVRFPDPRLNPHILSQPAHTYRFLKVMSTGVCSEATFDRLTGYRYGADVSVDSYLLAARDQAMPTIRGIIGMAEAEKLMLGAQNEQLDKLVALFNRNPNIANALRTAAKSIETVKPTKTDVITYEVPGEAVSQSVAPDRGDAPDSASVPVGLLRGNVLSVYRGILDEIARRLLGAPAPTLDSGPLLIYSDRLASLVRQPSGRHWFTVEVCAYRAYRPHGFHLVVCAEHDAVLNMASIIQCKFIGEVLSDRILLMPGGVSGSPAGHVLPVYSRYVFGQ